MISEDDLDFAHGDTKGRNRRMNDERENLKANLIDKRGRTLAVLGMRYDPG